MNPFDDKALCPKCGHNVVFFRYCTGGAATCVNTGVTLLNVEHMDRSCERCKYGWIQSCREEQGEQ